MSSTGGHPYVDISGRMELFGRLFGEQIGVPEPSTLPTAESLVAVIKAHVPPGSVASDEAPVFEAAAYVGEWLRQRASANWVSEGPYEPHLQLMDPTRSIVYLIPLVQLLRTASTAGYDGMTATLQGILRDVTTQPQAGPLDELRIVPDEDRAPVVAWTRQNLGGDGVTRASLWRRCSVCSSVEERALTLHETTHDWEEDAAMAAATLAATPFECPCGGPPGTVTRFLMLRNTDGAVRLGDIHISNTHTRVGCWTVDHDRAEPFDALSLAADAA